MRAVKLVISMMAFAACGEPGGQTDDDGGAPDGPVVTEALGDGVYETSVDATDEAAWTYFDFESRANVDEADGAWDLGALRFNVKTNGGTSGDGGAQVAVLEGTRFEDVAAAPADGWRADAASGPGVGGEGAMVTPGYVFDNWFTYDMANHTLGPVADRVYVLRTPEGNDFKIEMLAYYDDAGTPGFVRFRWAALG